MSASVSHKDGNNNVNSSELASHGDLENAVVTHSSAEGKNVKPERKFTILIESGGTEECEMTIGRLPEEIKERILTFVPRLNLDHLALLNRTWRRLINDDGKILKQCRQVELDYKRGELWVTIRAKDQQYKFEIDGTAVQSMSGSDDGEWRVRNLKAAEVFKGCVVARMVNDARRELRRISEGLKFRLPFKKYLVELLPETNIEAFAEFRAAAGPFLKYADAEEVVVYSYLNAIQTFDQNLWRPLDQYPPTQLTIVSIISQWGSNFSSDVLTNFMAGGAHHTRKELVIVDYSIPIQLYRRIVSLFVQTFRISTEPAKMLRTLSMQANFKRPKDVVEVLEDLGFKVVPKKPEIRRLKHPNPRLRWMLEAVGPVTELKINVIDKRSGDYDE